MTTQRVPCVNCGALILPNTAARTGGLCMPCFQRQEGVQKELHVQVLPENFTMEDLGQRFRRPTNAIRNCAVEFRRLCPQDWNGLEPTGDDSVRFCHLCRQNVFLCVGDAEALAHAREGHCIAMPGEDGSAAALMRVGMPEQPLTPKQERLINADCLDLAKTRALQALKYSSRFCPQCGYPCPDWREHCLVCSYQLGVVRNRE